MFLVDTNVLVELTRRQPDAGVIRWASGVAHIHLSVITVDELAYGLTWKPNARIQALYDDFLSTRCTILPVTAGIARHAGKLRGELRAAGTQRTQADMLIAATAAAHGLSVVTRNEGDFQGCGVAVLNPYAAQPMRGR